MKCGGIPRSACGKSYRLNLPQHLVVVPDLFRLLWTDTVGGFPTCSPLFRGTCQPRSILCPTEIPLTFGSNRIIIRV